MVTSVGYGYDDNGNQLTVTDGDGNVTSNTYSGNRVVETTVKDSSGTVVSTQSYAFDDNGNQISETDPDGRTISSTYVGNQMVSQTWYDASSSLVNTLSWSYDKDGNMLTASSYAGAYTMTYLDNRMASQVGPSGVTLLYGYDENNNVTTIVDSLGATTGMSYNENGQLLAVTYEDSSGQMREDFTYDDAGNMLTSTQYSDVLGTTEVGSSTYTYQGNQVASIVHKDGSGTVLASYSYSYDTANRLASEVDNGTTTSYGYDAAGQLISAGTQSYSYDLAGNPDASGDTVGPDNELLNDGTWSYTYDSAGNVTQKVDSSTGTTWTYGYDDQNHQISAEEKDSSGTVQASASYTFDVFGHRIESSITIFHSAPTVAYYLYSGNTLYATISEPGDEPTHYLSGSQPNQWLASVNAYGTVSWLETDHLNSVVLIATNSGTVINQISYDAFGNIISQTSGAPGLVLAYAGYQYDAVTGYYCAGDGTRELNPGAGVWTTIDPKGFAAGQANLHEYVANSPTNTTDPSGLDPADDDPDWQPPPPKITYAPNPDGTYEISLPGAQSQPTVRLPPGMTIEQYIAKFYPKAKPQSKDDLLQQQGQQLAKGYIDPKMVEVSTNPEKIPAERIDRMITDRLATSVKGGEYVYIADVAPGGGINQFVLKRNDFSNYKIVYTKSTPGVEGDMEATLKRFRTEDWAKRLVSDYRENVKAGDAQVWAGRLTFAYHVLPFGAAIDSAAHGDWSEALISFAGDVAFFLPFAAGAKGVTIARQLLLIGAGIEGSLAATRAAQGIFALQAGDNEKAAGCFGEATLRLIGMSISAVAALKCPIAPKNTNCFPAGTIIATENGPKPIQDIQPFERVWAFDLIANEWKLRHVIGTYQDQHEGDIVDVSVAGEQITSTGRHPWWVTCGKALSRRPYPEHVPVNPVGYQGQGRWVDAIDLRVGDVLLLRSGEQAAITGVLVRQARIRVYNFHVEDLHCYTVGNAQILVHNNSYKLGKSLEGNVRSRLAGEEAAHIVPAGDWANTGRSQAVKDAIANSQARVNEYLPGGIDGYYNGFWTSDSRHLGTHSDAYFIKMWDLLKNAKSENEVVKQLSELRKLAQSGVF